MDAFGSVPSSLPLLIDTATAARLTGTTPKHVRDCLRRGQIAGCQLGGTWRVNRDALLRQLGLANEAVVA